MHKIIIIGNLGHDPTMRYTPSGTPVTSFSVASNRKYKTSSGEQREETEWFNCQAFGKLAEAANQYLARGNKCMMRSLTFRSKPVLGLTGRVVQCSRITICLCSPTDSQGRGKDE